MAGQTLTKEEFQEISRKRFICICRFCKICFKKGRKKIINREKGKRFIYEGCQECYYPIVSLEKCVMSSCGRK